ncbi:hypothetical protein JOB18_015338 [Solea senegalensis]|uniref:Myb/SANT-like DNA-binding domain-containing protein n=2 Tax=Solea senegalensis TaxID=28829 RepID=A0AAV6RKC7_SOLSE|nr:uncharacterized protein si:ch1073-357b18.4 [Solea senegalensis]KAG7504735.1 hypothetical protein JOB18_015338 [Solea senegalensis]
MERNLQGSLATMHVKTEAGDENTSAPELCSQEPPARRGGGGGGGGVVDQTAEELQAAATSTPVLLYPVSTERFFTTTGDGKTFLKIAPASVMPPASLEKTLPSGSDFSSKAVLCLIEAVGRRWGLYETRERSQLFQSVQEEMASKGHVLPVEKIRRKWNNLIVTYKRVKDRSRETGHAKTSWEFFDLMDATLCDTVGSQILNSKRHKGGNSASTSPCPLAKIAAKPQLPQATTIVRQNSDFAVPGGLESAGQGAATNQIIGSTAAMTTVATATISPTSAPEVKPLIVLNGDIVTTSIHPAPIMPSPSFISSPCFTETASSSPSLGSPGHTDLNTSHCVGRKAPSFSTGVIPFRLNAAPASNNQKLLGLSSSFPPVSPCLTSSAATTLPVVSGSEAANQKRSEEQSSVSLLHAILKGQEEQVYQDQVARRRVEAREKRRERREVRMAEALGRIATALELLSSKQDTVIALLQRLADRK